MQHQVKEKPRVERVCEVCGAPDKPLVHVDHEDFHGWMCGKCFGDRWPGLLPAELTV